MSAGSECATSDDVDDSDLSRHGTALLPASPGRNRHRDMNSVTQRLHDTIYLLVTVNKHIHLDTTASYLRCDKGLVLTCRLGGRWRGRHCLVARYRGLLWVD